MTIHCYRCNRDFERRELAVCARCANTSWEPNSAVVKTGSIEHDYVAPPDRLERGKEPPRDE